MKKWSNSTKIVVGLVVLLIVLVVARSMTYRRMAHVIAHQAASQAAVEAGRKLILQGKLARVFKDSTNHAKYMAIRTAQLFAVDTTMVEVEDHHMTMAEAAAGSLVEFLSDMELTVRAAAADALGRMGKPAAKPLIEVGLNSPDKDVRSNSTRALTMIGEVAVPELIEAVKGGKPTQKVGAATALGDLQTARAISALIGALSAKEVDVRLTCRDALVTLSAAAVQPLVGALGDKSPFTRRHAAEALGEIGDPAAALPLLNLINDEHRLVRLAATYAVGKVKDPRAVPPLIAKLDDDDREMREAAAVSLGQLADQRAVARLIRSLSDPIEAVREQAAAALGRIKPSDPAQMALIEAETRSSLEGARAAAVLALGQIGSPNSV
ncbi:MAG: HEAT repeat domain-containing protein, partial [Armatimonadetes bacterium]|nr:HEAT repeat domain-containing protein [Armatimonadota bacterium]